MLLIEQEGLLEVGDGETTTQFTQSEIKEHVDLTAASKTFELKLDFGPYRFLAEYTEADANILKLAVLEQDTLETVVIWL